MHTLYFVRIEEKDAENSQEAREKACEYIDDDFTDWFVVGGRWTGILQEIANPKFDEKKLDTFVDSLRENNFLGSNGFEENAEKIQLFYEECGGIGKNKYNRDSYYQFGYDDDAVLIDSPEKHKKLVSLSEGDAEVFGSDICDEYTLKEMEWDTPYWIVVIDCQN